MEVALPEVDIHMTFSGTESLLVQESTGYKNTVTQSLAAMVLWRVI